MHFSSRNHRPLPRLPRILLLRAALASFGLSGCVPKTAYEEATSTAAVEREGHRRAIAKLSAAEAALARMTRERDELLAESEKLRTRVEKDEQKLAEAQLDVLTKEKAHEQEALLVTQLRGELARVGEHLKSYAGDRDELQAQLKEAEAQLQEKQARIALLEAQLSGLRTDLKTSEKDTEKTQQQLDGALSELAGLQEEVGEVEPERASDSEQQPPPRPSAEDEEAPADDEVEKEDESIYVPAEEVLPSDS